MEKSNKSENNITRNKGCICRFCGGVSPGWKFKSMIKQDLLDILYPCFCIDVLTDRIDRLETALKKLIDGTGKD